MGALMTESVGTAGAPLNLVAFRVSNGALSSEQLPDRLKLLQWGDNSTVKGKVRVTDMTLQNLSARQKSLGHEEVALDFEHNTVPGTPEFERTKEPRNVAAYGVPRVVSGEGLFLESLRWTPAGKEHALNYADLSPAVELGGPHGDEVSFVHSVALTRNGAVEGLQFFSVTLATTAKQENTMAENTGKLPTLAALAAILSLPENASEKEVMTKLWELSTPDLKALSARMEALETKLKEDGTTQDTADLKPLSARIEALETKLKEGATAQETAEKGRIIALFASEGKAPKKADGKTYSAEELQLLDVATLRLLHVNTTPTVTLSARGAVKEGAGLDPNLKGIARAIAAHKAGC